MIDFGIKYLQKSIASRDVEGVIQNLHTIIVNANKYKETLLSLGLTEDLIARFANASTSLAIDKQKQYEIINNRKNIVQNNLVKYMPLEKYCINLQMLQSFRNIHFQ